MNDEKTEVSQLSTEAPLTKKEIKAKKKAEKKELKRLKKERKLREKDKFHRVRSIVPYTRLIPYIMETRNTSQNFIFDKISKGGNKNEKITDCSCRHAADDERLCKKRRNTS